MLLGRCSSIRRVAASRYLVYNVNMPPIRRASELQAVQTLLRQIRLDAGLTQWDVAARLQMPQSYVSKYEAGTRRLDICELRRVLDALEMPLETFCAQLDLQLASLVPA